MRKPLVGQANGRRSLVIRLLFALTMMLLPASAKAQGPVFPGPPLVGTLAQRPTACNTLLQEYYATDNTTLYYSTVAGVSCTWVAVPGPAGSGVNTTGSPANTYLAGFTGAATISGTSAATLDSSGNLVALSLKATGLSSGLCVQTTTGGALTTAAGACGVASGSLTATGSPASGNLAKWSGATSVTNADLSGDCTTSGTLAITCTKTSGTAFAASATTDTTVASNISSGTLPAARLPNPSASTLGGIESFAAVSHQWIRQISTSGVPTASQPACGDLSNAAPSCSTDTTNASNITSGALPAAQLPAPTASTLGGVESLASVSHKWINTISTAGVPSATQPAAADLSDTATAGNYLRGNGTSFVSAAIQAGDIPTLNQSTTGSAASLSASSAIPNGTTATTQTALDNSTKLATTAYTDSAVTASNVMTTIGDRTGGGASGVPTRIAGGLTGQVDTATNGSTGGFASLGVGGRTVSTSAGDTILCDSGTTTRDRASTILYTSGSPETVTLPQAGSSGCSSNFVFSIFPTGAGAQTVTPTTSTINGQSTLVPTQNTWCSISSPDNTNYIGRCANWVKASTGLTPTYNADGSTTFSLATALPSTTTATTQSALDDSTKVATTAYADSAVQAIHLHMSASGIGAGQTNGTPSSLYAFNYVVLSQSITVTRIGVLTSAGTGCSTTAQYGIYDNNVANTSSVATVANGTANADSGAISISVASGHSIQLGVVRAESGCSGPVLDEVETIEYTVQ